MVHVSSPFFTLKKEYARAFCEEILNRNLHFRWKCVTRHDLLDEELVHKMADAGCCRIAFGVETLSSALLAGLNKKMAIESIFQAIDWCLAVCLAAGLQPRCLIIIGIPGQTRNDVIDTITRLLAAGAAIRPSAYAPLRDVLDCYSPLELDFYDRMLIHGEVDGMSQRELYNIVYNFDKWLADFKSDDAECFDAEKSSRPHTSSDEQLIGN